MSVASGPTWRAETLVASGDALGESPLWDLRTATVYWIDLLEPKLNSVSLDGTGFRQLRIPMSSPLGMIALSNDPGSLFLSGRGGLHLLDTGTGTVSHITDPSNGSTDIVFNDGKIDRCGRLWLGTSHELETEPKGALYMRLDDGTFRTADAGFAVSNGPAFSRDGTVLYFSDSARSRILAYDVPSTGLPLAGRRVFATFADGDGVPDGLTVDAEDCLWCAHWGGSCLTRFTREGTRIGRVQVPVPLVTSCSFAGADLKTLVITTARSPSKQDAGERSVGEGDIFRCRPGVAGLQ